jgi:transcriptional regulatory protein RtcR
MLLRALEEKTFLPLGSDRESKSDFQLIAGTNRDLYEAVHARCFREDLLARINLWTFCLPGLKQRPEDIEPNLQFELEQYARRTGHRVTFSKEARETFLPFALSPGADWKANFRDLNAAVVRMATLAQGGRISVPLVNEEIERLLVTWRGPIAPCEPDGLAVVLSPEQREALDPFDQVQLEHVISVCRRSRSLSEAGRALFHASRAKKASSNDADRLRKYLARFGLDWGAIIQAS